MQPAVSVTKKNQVNLFDKISTSLVFPTFDEVEIHPSRVPRCRIFNLEKAEYTPPRVRFPQINERRYLSA